MPKYEEEEIVTSNMTQNLAQILSYAETQFRPLSKHNRLYKAQGINIFPKLFTK